MSRFRVIHISDTHLSRDKPWFLPNFEVIAGVVKATRPDLVVNTGDVALDGPNREDDLAFARECHAALDVPYRAVPGNHDLGDNPPLRRPGEAITEERRARYCRHFGDDYWLVDAGSWMLVGVDAELLGSGLAAENEQWSFLSSVAARAKSRPVAVFVHKPLFNRDPAETEVNHRYVTPDSRRRLDESLAGVNVRLVASGHLHQHRRHHVAGIDYCWAPSTAYVLADRRQPVIGTKRVGYIEYVFDDGHVAGTIVEPPGLVTLDLDDFPEAYGH